MTSATHHPAARALRLVVALCLTVVAVELAARAVLPDHLPDPEVWPSSGVEETATHVRRAADDGWRGGTVVAGSSQARRIDIRVLEASGVDGPLLNASADGTALARGHAWLIGHVVPVLQPERIVLGVSLRDLEDWAEGFVEDYESARNLRRGWVGDLDRAIAERSVLLHHRPQLRGPSAALMSLTGPADQPAQPRTADEQGTWSGGDVLEPLVTARAERRLGRATYTTDALDDLGELARELATRDIELRLVLLPVPDPYTSYVPGGAEERDRLEQALRDRARRVDPELLDLTGRTASADFSDLVHLRPGPGREVSAEVARWLGGRPPELVAPLPALELDEADGGIVGISFVAPDLLEIELRDGLDAGAPGTVAAMHFSSLPGRRGVMRVGGNGVVRTRLELTVDLDPSQVPPAESLGVIVVDPRHVRLRLPTAVLEDPDAMVRIQDHVGPEPVTLPTIALAPLRAALDG